MQTRALFHKSTLADSELQEDTVSVLVDLLVRLAMYCASWWNKDHKVLSQARPAKEELAHKFRTSLRILPISTTVNAEHVERFSLKVDRNMLRSTRWHIFTVRYKHTNYSLASKIAPQSVQGQVCSAWNLVIVCCSQLARVYNKMLLQARAYAIMLQRREQQWKKTKSSLALHLAVWTASLEFWEIHYKANKLKFLYGWGVSVEFH